MKDPVYFQHAAGKSFFLSCDAVLPVPNKSVERSPFLVNICQQQGHSDVIQLPLDSMSVRSWLLCVRTFQQAELLTQRTDDELGKAIQVRHSALTSLKFVYVNVLVVAPRLPCSGSLVTHARIHCGGSNFREIFYPVTVRSNLQVESGAFAVFYMCVLTKDRGRVSYWCSEVTPKPVHSAWY